jgi:hypothetical protein
MYSFCNVIFSVPVIFVLRYSIISILLHGNMCLKDISVDNFCYRDTVQGNIKQLEVLTKIIKTWTRTKTVNRSVTTCWLVPTKRSTLRETSWTMALSRS